MGNTLPHLFNPRAGEVLVAMHGPGGSQLLQALSGTALLLPPKILEEMHLKVSASCREAKLTLSGIKEVLGALRYIATKD